MTENELRERLAMHGDALYRRGLAPGSSGNMSVRLQDGLLVTPTNSCMGRLDPARISKLSRDGAHLGGDKPSKEAFLRLAHAGVPWPSHSMARILPSGRGRGRGR